ncbi:sensor domain-containing diguanylate cyclase [Spiribacter vilamensis]|uniref:diguanylate cyclase n=1 Tax=Spiribacter vilamensis TaxID=531306 RepID=A0A4Q8D081_9GAMM|nr:diguanylate cyclase [Spiribacter vilamensis]RZU98662.1 diguanylate cyclase with PAS/PAC sensor [Spiribacter vilamensis]
MDHLHNPTLADPDTALPDDASLTSWIIGRLYDSVLITTTDLDPPGPLIVYANEAFCRKTGYSCAELIGQSPRILQGPATNRAVIDRLRENLKAGETFEGETVNYRKNGEPYFVRWNIRPFYSDRTNRHYYVSIQRETTREVEANQINDRIVESVAEGIIAIDANGYIRLLNPAARRLLDLSAERNWLSVHWRELFASRQDSTESAFARPIERVIQSGEPLSSHRGRWPRSDGGTIDIEISATPMTVAEGSDHGCVVIVRDNTVQRRFERRLWNAANRDMLTDAYNRRFGEEILTREIGLAEQEGVPLSLIYFDIDHFKPINDRYGHGVGDRILKALADCVVQRLRQSDYFVRWGGEEFLIILPGTEQRSAGKVAEALRERIAGMDFEHGPGGITVSAGVGQYKPHEDLRVWINRVDEALYAAKGAGRNRVHTAE